MPKQMSYPVMSADEVASLIPDGATVAFSGFSPAGAAKVVPRALAQRARALHSRGEFFKVRVLTGASVDDSIDGDLAGAKAISWRAPYQSNDMIRSQINR